MKKTNFTTIDLLSKVEYGETDTGSRVLIRWEGEYRGHFWGRGEMVVSVTQRFERTIRESASDSGGWGEEDGLRRPGSKKHIWENTSVNEIPSLGKSYIPGISRRTSMIPLDEIMEYFQEFVKETDEHMERLASLESEKKAREESRNNKKLPKKTVANKKLAHKPATLGDAFGDLFAQIK